MRRLLQRMLSIISIVLSVLLLTGCASQENTDVENVKVESDVAVSDESVAVASLESTGNDLKYYSKVYGDTLYFVEAEWDSYYQYYTTFSIHRQTDLAGNAEKIVGMEEAGLYTYVVDEESVYFLYSKGVPEEREFFFRKVSMAGDIIFDVPVSPDGETSEICQRMESINMGAVNDKGEVCLANAGGDMFLFDAGGQLLHMKNIAEDNDAVKGVESGQYTLVNAGKEGIFMYTPQDEGFVLREINFSNASLGEPIIVQLDDQNSDLQDALDISSREMPWEVLEIFNGYDMGMFLSNGDSLWRYDISEAELTKILNWSDSTVNLKGYMIDGIGIPDEESLYIMAHRSAEDVVFVRVNDQKIAEIPQKQIITVAMEEYAVTNEEMEGIAGEFNRSSAEYQIEIVPYASAEDLNLDLIKGEGPDIFFLRNMDILVLADKGVLEDLSPYFEKSSIVKESDLLPSIRRAGSINGKLLCVFHQYQINGFWVEKGTTDKGYWTPDDFIALAEKNPEAALVDASAGYHSIIIDTAMQADMDQYIDWQQKKCYFDSDEFIALMERIKQLDEQLNSVSAADVALEDIELFFQNELEKFYRKEVLTNFMGINTLLSYHYKIERNGGIVNGSYAELAGYPNQGGKPYFDLMANFIFGINSASDRKKAAWAFLEFLLSEEYQSKQLSFPVRQDCFDEFLLKDEIRGTKIKFSDEDREYIRHMVDNAYWSEASRVNGISRIISEETAPVWEGAKTAEEAAKIIQSRAMLYLNE